MSRDPYAQFRERIDDLLDRCEELAAERDAALEELWQVRERRRYWQKAAWYIRQSRDRWRQRALADARGARQKRW